MRKTYISFLALMLLVTVAYSQSPKSFRYQAVVRDGNGDVVVNLPVAFQISLISDSATGTVVYAETQSVSTNGFGLASLAIGEGTVVSGSFAGINWSSALHFIKVEVDISGGTFYVDMGTTQLLSVPYALNAKTSEDAFSGNYSDLNGVPLNVSTFNNDAGYLISEVDGSVINELQVLSVLNDTLYLSNGGFVSLAGYSDTLWRQTGNDIFNTNTGKVGIGTDTPPGKLVVKGDASLADTVPLFEVKDRTGATVFVVYPDSVRIFVGDDGTKTNKGAFAVSGRNTAKNVTHDFFTVTPDSVRVFLDSTSSMGGFAVKSFGTGQNKDFMSVYVDTAQIINPSVSRMLWYPSKEAFLSGRVLIQHPDSVGTNSWATGYEAKAIGDWSQSMGYHTVARGNYSTCIGKYSAASGESSFAFGAGARATAMESYAFGSGAVASGSGSYAIGSQGVDTSSGNPNGVYTKASGQYSIALGQGSQSTNLGSMCFGISDVASGEYSLSMGLYSIASGDLSVAIGTNAHAAGYSSFAIGIGATSNSPHSYALGSYCTANASSSYAIGYMSQTTGSMSAALGYLNLASGLQSLAAGSQSVASGGQSYAIGNSAIASGNLSTSIGSYTIASGLVSTALGVGSEANGDYSTSLGYYTKATGLYSVSIGLMSYSSGDYSYTMGTRDTATGYSSFAFGTHTKSTGYVSTSMGYRTIADGDYSYAAGINTKAKSYASFVVGRYNDTTFATSGIWFSSDPLFIVGNGSADNNRSNAMMVQKDGEVYFPFVYNISVGATNRDLYIDNTGRIGYLSSSRRYKQDITNIENVDWIYKLRPVNYSYISDIKHSKEYGLIAEEVQEVNPLFVSFNADGSVETVNYSKLVTPLLKAIQDQKALIDQQQKQIEILMQNNSVMKSEINDLKKNLVQK